MTDVIDVHTHIVPTRLAAVAQAGGARHGIEFGRDELGRVTSSIGRKPTALPWPTPLETPAERVASMDAIGVDTHLLSLTPTMHWYDLDPANGLSLAVETNDDIADIAAAHPGRFRGMAFLPLQDPPAAVRELERCMRDLGFAGALVGTHVRGRDWDDPDLYPILEAARDLGAFVFFHPTRGRANTFLTDYHLRNLIGNPLETAVALARLIFGGVLDRLGPDARLCFAHGGGYGCLGIARMDRGAAVREEATGIERLPSDYVEGVYVDSLVHGHRTLDYLLDLLGAERILLGSDYPADMGQPDPVGWIRSHPGLTAEQQAMILSENAAAILS